MILLYKSDMGLHFLVKHRWVATSLWLFFYKFKHVDFDKFLILISDQKFLQEYIFWCIFLVRTFRISLLESKKKKKKKNVIECHVKEELSSSTKELNEILRSCHNCYFFNLFCTLCLFLWSLGSDMWRRRCRQQHSLSSDARWMDRCGGARSERVSFNT